ncbi:hypothetical protein EMGR_002937 [Emarellia grisea]|nr:hypothetical protein KXX39_004696 [Aspergillus fumigatus]
MLNPVVQFHGKWPFRRILGMQEPFSVLFSLLNLLAHWNGIGRIKETVPAWHSLRPYYLTFGYCGLACWTFSMLFHTRDFPLTEKLDYFGAGANVMYGLYLAIIRILRLDQGKPRYKPTLRRLTTTICVLLYTMHVCYLSFWSWDYTYNMIANVVVGAIQNILWTGFSIVRYQKQGKVWMAWPGMIVVWIMLAMSLELQDFPPWHGLIDAHSLWHLGTVIPTAWWYMYLIKDIQNDVSSRRLKGFPTRLSPGPVPQTMASPAVRKAISDAALQYAKPEGKIFQYGTAGFRMKADLLNTVVYAVGLLATLRSKKLSGQWIGVMVTASHNPAEDNGVKLVDPMAEWEAYATKLANAPLENIGDVYDELVKEIDVSMENPARVVFARDTRASGSRLIGVLSAALTATEAEFIDMKFMTTPQLHYVVRCKNTLGTQYEYGEPTEQGYYEKLAAAFKRVMRGVKVKGSLTVDCANGVGGPKLRELIKYLPEDTGLDIKIVNDDVINPDSLNFECGADYVKTKQRAPPSSKASILDRCASLDGDADRIVYYFLDEGNVFRLLDGDRIATLAASFIGDLARSAGIAQKLKIGVVQTAYANGSSTEYIEKVLKLPSVCTNTGVKHLHHAAMRFDVGVYFEANGHGTITFSENALKTIKNTEPQSPAQQRSLECLQALTDLINQAVGDAISDMLLVEAILAHKGWTPKEWLATYTDLPSRLVRVEVADRSIFKAYDAERKLESPPGLQAKIDSLQSRYNKGRSFARASGTEDAVRVYAEAASRSEADDLATRVANAVRDAGTVKEILQAS